MIRSSSWTMSFWRRTRLCWTDQCFAGNGAADVRAVLEVQHGRIPRGVVNRDVLDRAGFKAKLESYGKHFK